MSEEKIKWQLKLLRLFCRPEYLEEIEGEFLERYHQKKSRWWLTLELIKLIHPRLIKKFEGAHHLNHYGIAKNQLITSLRFLARERAFTVMNIVGLSTGMVCCLFIYLWLNDELKWNAHLADGDRVCTIMNREIQTNGDINTHPYSPYRLKEVLDENFPIIESSAVLSKGNWMAFQVGEELVEWQGVDATPEIFSLFELTFLKGGFEPQYDNPSALVISSRLAEVHFGNDWQNKNVIGTFMENDQGETFELVGIYENLPRHTTVRFEFVVPFYNLLKKRRWLKSWGINASRLFVKMKSEVNLEQADTLLQQAINDHRVGDFQTSREIFLQPYEDMYLYNRFENGQIAGGRIDYVRLLSITAILVLLLATINFMNLTTARATKRFKETGVRKVLGASSGYIRFQFQMESFLMTILSLGFALILIVLLFPQFEDISHKSFDLSGYSWKSALYLGAFALVQGTIAGIYPSLFISSFKSISLLKNAHTGVKSKVSFGKILVVFQFIITMVMIVGSLTVHQQVSFIQNKNIGLDRSNLIRTFSYDMDPITEYQSFKADLLSKPGIEQVTMVDNLLIEVKDVTSHVTWDGKDHTDELEFFFMQANPDFIPTMKIEVKAGRNFDWALQSDTNNFLINETAQALMNMPDAVGKKIAIGKLKGTIVGVVHDFHNASLHSPIEPLIIVNQMSDSWMILARHRPGMEKEALVSLEEAFRTYNNPDRAFWYRFLDDMFDAKYRSEQMVKELSYYFTFVSIVISLIGLIAMVAYNTERRAKEVGIRKVLGATWVSILGLLSSNYIRLMLLSMIIAFPISYFIVDSWLEGFAYRIDHDWQVFALSGVGLLILVVTVVGLQTHKVANANPVNILKDE